VARSRQYVGRRAAALPVGRSLGAVGCGTLAWAGLIVILGLAFYSVAAIWPPFALLSLNAPLSWLFVVAASLAWPSAYYWGGWFRTLLGYWPAPGEGEGVGASCETCGSAVRRGRTQGGHYICDVCATERVRDNRRLVAPPVILVGVAFVANGVGALLQVFSSRADLAGQAATAAEARWRGTLGAMGAVGGAGLALAGIYVTVRAVRRLILEPIGPAALQSARAQIAAALDRERAAARR